MMNKKMNQTFTIQYSKMRPVLTFLLVCKYRRHTLRRNILHMTTDSAPRAKLRPS